MIKYKKDRGFLECIMGDEDISMVMEALGKFSSKKNDQWDELRGDHSLAHDAGMAAYKGALKEIGKVNGRKLDKDEVHKAVTAYAVAHHSTLTGTAKEGPSFKKYRMALKEQEVATFLKNAQDRGNFTYEELFKDGLEGLLNTYRINQEKTDEARYSQHLAEQIIDKQDIKKLDALAKQVITYDRATLGDKNLFEVKDKIHDHIIRLGNAYENKQIDTTYKPAA